MTPAPETQAVGTILAYHGTKHRFDSFREGEDGVCFTTDRRVAGRYAGRAGRVVAANLTVRHPYVTDLDGWEGEACSPASVKEEGEHDSYIVRDWAGPGRDMVIVFSNDQIQQVE